MRTILGIGLAVSILFVGVTAVSESAQQHSATTDAGNSSVALADGVFGGTIEAAGPAVVIGGIAAVIVVSLGILLTAGRSGGR